MKHCGAVHPERPELVCERSGEPAGRNHPEHTAYDLSDELNGFVDWSNSDYVTPVKVTRWPDVKRRRVSSQYMQTMRDMAERTRGGHDG